MVGGSEGGSTRFSLENLAPATYQLRLQLPPDVTCTQCIFQVEYFREAAHYTDSISLSFCVYIVDICDRESLGSLSRRDWKARMRTPGIFPGVLGYSHHFQRWSTTCWVSSFSNLLNLYSSHSNYNFGESIFLLELHLRRRRLDRFFQPCRRRRRLQFR